MIPVYFTGQRFTPAEKSAIETFVNEALKEINTKGGYVHAIENNEGYRLYCFADSEIIEDNMQSVLDSYIAARLAAN